MNSRPPNPLASFPRTQNENPSALSHSAWPWMLLVKNMLAASDSNRNRTALPTRPSTRLAEHFSLGGANRISSIEAMSPSCWANEGELRTSEIKMATTGILVMVAPKNVGFDRREILPRSGSQAGAILLTDHIPGPRSPRRSSLTTRTPEG